MGIEEDVIQFMIAWVILALSSYRVSTWLANDKLAGPLGLLDKFRYHVGLRYNEMSEPVCETQICEAIMCTECNSFWVSLFVFGIYLTLVSIHPALAVFLFVPLSISGFIKVLTR